MLRSTDVHVSDAHADEQERRARRVGALCVLTGALSLAWALFSKQSPTSPLHVAGVPSAIEQLSLRAWSVGLSLFVLAPQTVRALSASRARLWVHASAIGAAALLAAHAIAARSEIPGVQLLGAHGLGRGLAYLRLLGGVTLVACLVVALRVHTSAVTRSPRE